MVSVPWVSFVRVSSDESLTINERGAMKTSVYRPIRWWFSVLALSAIVATPLLAQEKANMAKGQSSIKVLAENDKFRAFESIYEPGDVNKNVPKVARVVRALTDGTLMRTYPDGKTEKIEWKAGQVRAQPPAAQGAQYTTKNVGNTRLVLYVVVAK